MTKKLISFDDEKQDLGLPDDVQARMDARYSGSGTVPYIGENGNWWVGDEDLGVLARQVVMSPNPFYPLAEGQVLLILPSETFFTDFTEYGLDQAPHDWTPEWGLTESSLKIVSDATASGGIALSEGPSEQFGRAYAWQAIGTRGDVEVVMKWKSTNIAAGIRPLVRGSSPGTHWGIHGGAARATETGISSNRGSSTAAVLVESPTTLESDVWYVTRLRVEGDQVNEKTWPAAAAEPTGWTNSATETTAGLQGGFVGLRVSSMVHTRRIDWFGVGVDGAAAPTGPMVGE